MLSDLMDIRTDENGNAYSANSIPNCVSYNHVNSQAQLLLGKALMIPAADWFYTEMEATIEDEENIGFMPVPWMSDEAGNPVTAEGVEMPKDKDGNYPEESVHGKVMKKLTEYNRKSMEAEYGEEDGEEA